MTTNKLSFLTINILVHTEMLGGCTVNINNISLFIHKGYAVSTRKDAETITSLDNAHEVLQAFIKEHEIELQRYMLGTWVNQGMMYIDLIKVYDDKGKALRAAKKHNQLAIFDLRRNKEIFLTNPKYSTTL